MHAAVPDEINADDFAENILGFEEVDENELEEDEQSMAEEAMMGGSMASGAQTSYLMAGKEVIPEEPM